MVKEHALEQKWLFSHYFCHKFDEKVEKYFFQTQRRNLAIYVLDELFTPVHGDRYLYLCFTPQLY